MASLTFSAMTRVLLPLRVLSTFSPLRIFRYRCGYFPRRLPLPRIGLESFPHSSSPFHRPFQPVWCGNFLPPRHPPLVDSISQVANIFTLNFFFPRSLSPFLRSPRHSFLPPPPTVLIASVLERTVENCALMFIGKVLEPVSFFSTTALQPLSSGVIGVPVLPSGPVVPDGPVFPSPFSK